MSNLLIQQYGKYKRQYLDENPFSCLLDTSIDINPHQVDAFCAAVKSLKTGGIILADEVGLGKTIEAGLVIKYVIKTGAKKILISLPASLRKQWEVELLEKFDFDSESIKILDRQAINYDPVGIEDHWLKDSNKVSIALTSYDFSSKLMKKYPNVKWDFVVIDEAHNMRNIFHGTKRAKRLYEQTHNIPKILLTATPLQNNLSDLHGLVSFIDPRIFGTEKAFNKHYKQDYNYAELKQNLLPVLYRTLRKDVSKYMQFANRVSRTFDFQLSYDEVALYMRVNKFLKRDYLYSLPTANRNLLTLVIRKLLASSSFALIETFEVILERLQKLLEGTKSKDAQEDICLPPENDYKMSCYIFSPNDEYIYTPKKLTVWDTIYLNSLILGQTHDILGFGDITKVIDSIVFVNVLNSISDNELLRKLRGLDALERWVDNMLKDKYFYIFNYYKELKLKCSIKIFDYIDKFAYLMWKDVRENRYVLEYLLSNENMVRSMDNFKFMGSPETRVKAIKEMLKKVTKSNLL